MPKIAGVQSLFQLKIHKSVNAISLFELNEFIRRVLALNFPESLWIRAELAQVNQARGHYFIDLVEKANQNGEIVAQSSAALWQQQYRLLKKQHGDALEGLLQEGLEVQLKVQVSFHERYGMKLIIEDIDPTFTLGKLEIQRREILKTLAQENLLEKNAEIPLPPVLQRVAVLSSERAAGYQDFLDQLAGNPYGYQFHMTLFAAAVQGMHVETEMLEQLEAVFKSAQSFDCVVIIRGGGAKLDLAGFDSLPLARAVANAPLPVLTGIGHEVDETVLDAVAHISLKTPTAVAEFLIHHCLRFESELMQSWQLVQQLTKHQLHEQRLMLQQAVQSVHFLSREHLREQYRQLDFQLAILKSESSRRLLSEKDNLNHAANLCHSLSPEATLKRGFSITWHNGKALTAADEVKAGDELKTALKNGFVHSRVE